MKNLVQLLLLCTMLILNSCSTYVERVPAQVDAETLNSIFTFSSGVTGNESYEPKVKEFVATYFNHEVVETNRQIGGKLIPVSSLPGNAAYKLELDIDPKTSKPMFNIYHTASAFKDEVATFGLLDMIVKMTGSGKLSRFAFFEMYYNAKSGDPVALDNFLKLRTDIQAEYTFEAENEKKIFESAAFKKNKAKYEKMRESLKEDIKNLKASRAVAREKRKIGLDLLDKAPEGQQFRAMVAKGDRKGAAAVLRKYLPWEGMAAFEARFWQNYLEIMVNPVPLEQRVFIYRGLNDDFIHKAAVAGKELTTEQAIVDGKAFIMSSVMVKNQGSWNRRLRSLEAMNQKFIATYMNNDEYAQSARITTIFSNHSGDPMGSPFISFSPKYSVADGFGQTRVSAYLVDPRLLSFNYASGFDNEAEYLIPLTTFPDELVGIADKNLSPEFADTRNVYLDKKLEAMIAKQYGAKKDEVLTKIKKNSFQFFTHAQSELVDVPGKNPAADNITFYKKFLPKAGPPAVLSPKGDLQCMDLIALFWMAK